MNEIGRYEIRRKLGQGGMAAVYLAQDPHFNREVAVKVLPANFLDDDSLRHRFEREAQTVANLEHYAIVPVYDYGQSPEQQPYLVMRYMRGGSLSSRLGERPLSITESIPIIERIAAALDAAHSKGIIHRDLKPDNILFDEYEAAYLSDFGIVKLAQATQNLTATGGIVGTPAYMSPEQVKGEGQVDGRSDIYALGVVLYQMLTADLPFQGDTPFQTAMKHVLDPVPIIQEKNPALPAGMQTVINLAMAKEAAHRFNTGRELVEALKQVEANPAVIPPALAAASTVLEPLPPPPLTSPGTGTAVPDPAAVPVPIPAEPEKKSRKWIWLLALLLLLCISAGGVLYTERDRFFPQGGVTAVGAGADATNTPAQSPTSESAAGTAGTDETPGTAEETGTATSTAEPTTSPSTTPSPTASTTAEPTPTTAATPSSTATTLPTSTATTLPTNTPTTLPTSTPTTLPTNTPTSVPSPTATEVNIDIASGRLTHSGDPVAGITVALLQGACNASSVIERTTSDADGRYQFSGVAPGSYLMAFNGWNSTGAVVEPYLGSCSWDLEKTAGSELILNWTLEKNDLLITYPANGAVVTSTTPTFTWNAYPGATRYEVIIQQNSPTSTSIAWLEPVNGTSYQHPAPLPASSTFDFRVWAYDASGDQIATNAASFSTP